MPTFLERANARAWSLGVLMVSIVTFPYVCAIVLAMAAWHRLTNRAKTVPPNGKTVIVSGGKMCG